MANSAALGCLIVTEIDPSFAELERLIRATEHGEHWYRLFCERGVTIQRLRAELDELRGCDQCLPCPDHALAHFDQPHKA